MTKENPTINFVGRSAGNNGVADKVDLIQNITPYRAGCITVALGGSLGSAYLQTEDFYTSQNVVVLSFDEDITDNAKLFLTTSIMNESKYKYFPFGRELNTHIRTDFGFALPIKQNINGKPIIDATHKYSVQGYIPDWEKMSAYIGKLHHKPITTRNKNSKIKELKITEWKEFDLIQLFRVEAGNYYSKDLYDEGNTPYISASDTNNGIGEKTNLQPDFSGNKITIGKVGATTYYQSEDFCATSDVNVLTPLFNMNKPIGLFITTVINASENYKWSYGRQCRVGDTKEIVIKLPVKHNFDGSPIIDKTHKYSNKGYVPDWQFMENYIKSLPYGDRI